MKKPPLRVFVVEDHAGTARGLKMFLELAGYEIFLAQSVQAALALSAHTPFDVLVCDLNLPDGTGWELMEKLRARRPVRGIVFSAYDEPEHVARSRAAGFDEHIVKGTTPEALLAAIDRLARFAVPPEQPRLRSIRPKKSPVTRARKSTTAKAHF